VVGSDRMPRARLPLTPQQVEAVHQQLEGVWDIPVVDHTRRGYRVPDPDYMVDLADRLDIDVSHLYDMYYGYPPGSRGR